MLLPQMDNVPLVTSEENQIEAIKEDKINLEQIDEKNNNKDSCEDSSPISLINKKIVFELKEIHCDDLQFLEVVGKGSFGVVHKAKWLTPSMVTAVKIVETDNEFKALHNECKQLARVSHENIIKMYGVGAKMSKKYLVMEFADGGSLYELLYKPPSLKYSLVNCLSWLLQCAKAIAYLHDFKPTPILHRDLKPLNMLLMNNKRVLKICDFGTACDLRNEMTDNKGSTAWMAPEIMTGEKYSEKCDVYSWGMILWELLTRRIPFKELGLNCRILWKVVNDGRPPLIHNCPKPLDLLMQRCWGKEEFRPTMQEVISLVLPIYKLLDNKEEYSQFSEESESFSESCVSPLNEIFSDGRTSQDVSELPSSTDDQATPTPQQTQDGRGSETSSPILSKIDHLSPNFANVSANVVISGAENLVSPWGTATLSNEPSPTRETFPTTNDMLTPLRIDIPTSNHENFPAPRFTNDMLIPLKIDIPNAGLRERHDLEIAQQNLFLSSPQQAMYHLENQNDRLTPLVVPMRQHLQPSDPEAKLKRRSAEVLPTNIQHKPGHKRSSSYESNLIGFESLHQEILVEDPNHPSQYANNENTPAGYFRTEASPGFHQIHRAAPPPPRLSSSYPRNFAYPSTGSAVSPYPRNWGNIGTQQVYRTTVGSCAPQSYPHVANTGSQSAYPTAIGTCMPQSYPRALGTGTHLQYPSATTSGTYQHYHSGLGSGPQQPYPGAIGTATQQPYTTVLGVSSRGEPYVSPVDISTREPYLREVVTSNYQPYPSAADINSQQTHSSLNTGIGGSPAYSRTWVNTNSQGGVIPSMRVGIPAPLIEGHSNSPREELGPLWELLDEDLKPPMPLKDSPHSHQIFKDHEALAHQLLVVQEEIVFLDQEKSKLLKKLQIQEKEQSACKERYNQNINHLETQNDNLRQTFSRLNQQVEEIKRERNVQGPNSSPTTPPYYNPLPPNMRPPPPYSYDHQQ